MIRRRNGTGPTVASPTATRSAWSTTKAPTSRPARKGRSSPGARGSSPATATPPSTPRPSCPDGWFRTGDIGRFDADGYLIITDRKKDIIIRGGENIASREVEDLLVLHPGIAEAAVCAAPDPLLGEQVCAFVVPRPGAHIDLDVVRAHFAGLGVARHKAPERVETVTDLPRTATGKVKKTDLRALLRTDAESRVRSENLKSLSRTDPASAPTATGFRRGPLATPPLARRCALCVGAPLGGPSSTCRLRNRPRSSLVNCAIDTLASLVSR